MLTQPPERMRNDGDGDAEHLRNLADGQFAMVAEKPAYFHTRGIADEPEPLRTLAKRLFVRKFSPQHPGRSGHIHRILEQGFNRQGTPCCLTEKGSGAFSAFPPADRSERKGLLTPFPRKPLTPEASSTTHVFHWSFPAFWFLPRRKSLPATEQAGHLD